MKQTYRLLAVLFLLTGFGLSAAGKKVNDSKEVNVYSHRHYDVDKKIFEEFEEETGIKVNVTNAKADELIKRLEAEGENTKADVLITVDAGRLYRAKKKGLFQPVRSAYLEKVIPENLRSADNEWFGLTKRARVIVYAKDRVKPSELSTYEALTDPKWKGKILIRSSNNIYNQSLLASVIANQGETGALKWARGIVANMARVPSGNDRAQVMAVAAGVGDLAVVNTYYIGKMAYGSNAAQKEAEKKVAVFFPNQETTGTHVNISGAGVVKYAKNKENAVKFIEYLAGPEAQKIFAEGNYEYPVVAGVPLAPIVKSWGKFKEDNLTTIDEIGEYNADAIKIFDEAGWR